MALLFSGCSWCEVEVLVPEPYPVPVKCAVPHTPCNIGGNEAEIALQLAECITTIRKDAEVCQ